MHFTFHFGKYSLNLMEDGRRKRAAIYGLWRLPYQMGGDRVEIPVSGLGEVLSVSKDFYDLLMEWLPDYTEEN